ncbi:MAG: HAMP domain-containing sensor histidine kinase, partial [Gemmatimonadaceae bacterium]
VQGPVTDEQRTSLARITWSQKHLLGLINEILSFAKLETGGVSVTSTDVNVNDLLESVEAMVAPQMARKALRYVVHDSDGDCDSTLAIWGDADKVRQILLNLLTNALKFTEADGSIDVTCGTSDGYVAIGVRDTGIGIPADHLSVIFEPFVQVNPSLTRVIDGVGLGLAISRELARAMGGDITVESALGVGSTFTLSLPRVPKLVTD